jgi:hypothetical protein
MNEWVRGNSSPPPSYATQQNEDLLFQNPRNLDKICVEKQDFVQKQLCSLETHFYYYCYFFFVFFFFFFSLQLFLTQVKLVFILYFLKHEAKQSKKKAIEEDYRTLTLGVSKSQKMYNRVRNTLRLFWI